MIRLSEHVEHVRERVLVDALREATARFWHRRAADLEAARPKPGDFHGRATRFELAARDKRCADIAQACRQHAELLERELPDDMRAEVAAVMREAA